MNKKLLSGLLIVCVTMTMVLGGSFSAYAKSSKIVHHGKRVSITKPYKTLHVKKTSDSYWTPLVTAGFAEYNITDKKAVKDVVNQLWAKKVYRKTVHANGTYSGKVKCHIGADRYTANYTVTIASSITSFKITSLTKIVPAVEPAGDSQETTETQE